MEDESIQSELINIPRRHTETDRRETNRLLRRTLRVCSLSFSTPTQIDECQSTGGEGKLDVYQYLRFLMNDDDRLEQIRQVHFCFPSLCLVGNDSLDSTPHQKQQPPNGACCLESFNH